MGAEEFVVTVPRGRCEEPVPTSTTFNRGVQGLGAWSGAEGIIEAL